MIGTTLQNRYKMVKLLGSGGFSDTYLAFDLYIPIEGNAGMSADIPLGY